MKNQLLRFHPARQHHQRKDKKNHPILHREKVDHLQQHSLHQKKRQQESRHCVHSIEGGKPINKPRQETQEEKEERERLEKIADDAAKQSAAELIAQEQQEKKKLSDKDAKAKQAAAANTERAREAADKMKKKKEADKAEEKPSRAVTRRMKKVPDEEDGDPPGDDQTPWTIFKYKQPKEVRADYTYDGVTITNKMNVIDPQYTVSTKAAVWGTGKPVKPGEAVLFLQRRQAYAGAKHRIRDIRSVQIERHSLTMLLSFLLVKGETQRRGSRSSSGSRLQIARKANSS